MKNLTKLANFFKSKNKGNMKIAALGLTAVAIVIVALVASALVLTPQNNELTPTDETENTVDVDNNSWLFKGAYAQYEGTTSLLLMTFNVEMRQEVINFNETHAELLTYLSLNSDFVDSEETNTTIWVDLEENQYEIDEASLTNKYETTETFEKYGSRECIVYEYSTEGPTILVYVDKQIGWPLKMSMELTGEENINLNIDIELTETNIPELM
jgi:heme/copper-type cytochrome/quinol oxidase subunit 2